MIIYFPSLVSVCLPPNDLDLLLNFSVAVPKCSEKEVDISEVRVSKRRTRECFGCAISDIGVYIIGII